MDDFFSRYTKLAILGVSRDPKAFSRQAYAFLHSNGYELYPVNPNTETIEGQKCYPSIESLPDVQAAVFFTPPRVSEQLLPLCKDKGIVNVWFQQGSADQTVLELAGSLGMSYRDSCVFLHHPESGFPHNLHRFMVKVFSRDKYISSTP